MINPLFLSKGDFLYASRQNLFDVCDKIELACGSLAMIPLPDTLKAHLEKLFEQQLKNGDDKAFDFSQPKGEPGLLEPNSVSWKVFSNPVSLLIGGIAAVLLELAEPRVRTGVWEHTSFRTHPLQRMRRTGLAAMITVYGARSHALPMIEAVTRMHEKVTGTTPEGEPYTATDPSLLTWVHATASYGFLEAYHAFVQPLSAEEKDQFYLEGVPIAKLYGADHPPSNSTELASLFASMSHRLQSSEILDEFVSMMEELPLIPGPTGWLNPLFVDAAVELIPPKLRRRLCLDHRESPFWARRLFRSMAQLSAQLNFRTSPHIQAAARLKNV